MTTQTYYPIFATLLLTMGLMLCPTSILRAQMAHSVSEPVPTGETIEITATDYAFRAPDEIPSGWTTIQFTNEGEEPHFVFLSRLPDGKTIDDYETDLSMAFNEVWYSVRDDGVTQENAMAMLGESLPEWFPTLQFIGGPGFASPGHLSETTLRLEPGRYVLECYVKTEDGEFHYMEGMLRPLTVTEDVTPGSQPESDIRVTLSNYEMTVEGTLSPGRHTISVHAAQNPEQGFGHSAHLARLDRQTDVQEIVRWMNALGIDGLRSPAPAEFLGGVHMMPTGNTGYFTADLTPGRYLFISEATAHQGMHHEFTVAP